METYSWAEGMEAPSGWYPVSEWTVPAGQTGLEEPLGQLWLGGGADSYPEQPVEADCRYYLKTGYCSYGDRCWFNHPRVHTMVMGAMRASGRDYPERLDQPVCQYYMKTGMCKFGASCKYHHLSQGGGSPMPTTLNIYGYPLRMGEKECSYYVKSGQCKYGVTCKFHHPQPAGVQYAVPVLGPGPGLGPMLAPAAEIYPTAQPNQQHGVPSGSWPVARPTMFPQGMVSIPGRTSYPAPVRPAASASTQPSVGASPVYGVTQLSPQAPAYTEQYVPVSSFPAPSGSIPMSDIFAGLPQEVSSDILKHLPVKSIGISRCVSKSWLSLLTSYEFIKAHLAHHTHIAEQKLLLLSSPLSSLTLHSGGNHLRQLQFFEKQKLLLRSSSDSDSLCSLTLVGSCNGLVFVATKGWSVMWLFNCLTEECVKLPDSPFALPQFSFIKYGFGYDSLHDDYKIVKISQCDYGFENSHGYCPDIFVDIYSLKMRSWKRFGTAPDGHDLLDHASCMLINGALHWTGLKSSRESTVIVAFDLSFEKFEEIPAPAFVDNYEMLSAKLTVVDKCLGIVLNPYGAERTEIWFMKSYTLVESWTKLVVDFKPLCFHQDKILFRDPWPRALKGYCLKDGRVEVCLAEDDTPDFREGITYSESLASPHIKSRY